MNSIMEIVCLICNKIQANTKHGILFPKLLVSLRKEFKLQNIELKIRSKKDKNLATSEYYVNAYYDAFDDQNFEVPIEVIVNNNFENSRSS